MRWLADAGAVILLLCCCAAGGVIVIGLIHNTLELPAAVVKERGDLTGILDRGRDGMRFFVCSDTQTGPNVLRKMLAALEKARPSFAIICGDMVVFDTVEHWQVFLAVLRSGDPTVPVFLVAGNHEWKPRNMKVRTSGLTVFERLLGRTHYWFSCGENLFVVLDNGLHVLEEDARQWNWLRDLFVKKAKDYDNVFVFMHRPPFAQNIFEPECTHLTVDSYAQFRRLMAQYGVKAVFCGHSHRYRELVDSGVRYYLCSGGGRLAGHGEKNQFLDVTVEGPKLQVAKVDVLQRRRSLWDVIAFEVVTRIFPTLRLGGWAFVTLVSFVGAIFLMRAASRLKRPLDKRGTGS